MADAGPRINNHDIKREESQGAGSQAILSSKKQGIKALSKKQ